MGKEEIKIATVTFALKDGTVVESNMDEKHLDAVTALLDSLKVCEHEYPDDRPKGPPDCTRCGVNYAISNPDPIKEDVPVGLDVSSNFEVLCSTLC